MAQLFAVKTNHFYQKPNLEVVLMDADCIESLLGTVSLSLKMLLGKKLNVCINAGTKPNVCINAGTVCMQFEAWELEKLSSKQLINDFFQMYGKSGMNENSDFYMHIPVEALLLLEEALVGQMKQDHNAFT